jgi:hypothetical protein
MWWRAAQVGCGGEPIWVQWVRIGRSFPLHLNVRRRHLAVLQLMEPKVVAVSFSDQGGRPGGFVVFFPHLAGGRWVVWGLLARYE